MNSVLIHFCLLKKEIVVVNLAAVLCVAFKARVLLAVFRNLEGGDFCDITALLCGVIAGDFSNP